MANMKQASWPLFFCNCKRLKKTINFVTVDGKGGALMTKKSIRAKFAVTIGIVIAILQYGYTIWIAPLFSSAQFSSVINIVVILGTIWLIYLLFKRTYPDF